MHSSLPNVRFRVRLLLIALSMATAGRAIPAQPTATAVTTEQSAEQGSAVDTTNKDGGSRDTYRVVVGRAVAYLLSVQQSDGSFAPQLGSAGTALATTALLYHGVPIDDPAIARALQHLRTFRHDDGGLYQPDSLYKNYETCLAAMCIREAQRLGQLAGKADPADQQLLANAIDFLRGEQWDQGEGLETSDPAYGGAGYGTHERPDLSNTSYLTDALKSLGVASDDPIWKRCEIFVSRCQNLESDHNTTEFASKNPDGGFYYTPAAGGTSQAGTTDAGGLRSYGSMTYAGLKSLLYAGVDRNDPRVVAAYEWITRNYDLSSNPGLGSQGLYYYYHTFAKSLAAWGHHDLVDATGARHRWQDELVATLAKHQRSDGSWVNDHPRWREDDPALVTAYSLLALHYCR